MKPLAKDIQLCKPQSQEQKQSQDSGASAIQHSRGCLGPGTGPGVHLLGGTREQASSNQKVTSLSPLHQALGAKLADPSCLSICLYGNLVVCGLPWPPGQRWQPPQADPAWLAQSRCFGLRYLDVLSRRRLCLVS